MMSSLAVSPVYSLTHSLTAALDQLRVVASSTSIQHPYLTNHPTACMRDQACNAGPGFYRYKWIRLAACSGITPTMTPQVPSSISTCSLFWSKLHNCRLPSFMSAYPAVPRWRDLITQGTQKHTNTCQHTNNNLHGGPSQYKSCLQTLDCTYRFITRHRPTQRDAEHSVPFNRP